MPPPAPAHVTATRPKLAALLLTALAAAVVLAGCQVGFGQTAATVNGVAISQSQLDAHLAAIEGNAAYSCIYSSSTRQDIAGVGKGTYNSQFVANILLDLVINEAMGQQAAREGIHLTAFDRTAAKSEVENSLSSSTGTAQSGCPSATAAQIFQAFPAFYRSFLLNGQAEIEALAAHQLHIDLSMAGLGRYFRSHRSTFVNTCADAIVVATQAQAQSLSAQLAGGASFAALARKDSLDSSARSGGHIGCAPTAFTFPANLAAAVAATPVGHVTPPIATQSSSGSIWVLVKVDGRSLPAFDSHVAQEVRSELLYQNSQRLNAAESSTLTSLLQRASVTVDPRDGRWLGSSKNLSSSFLVAPAPPPGRFVPNATADQSAQVPAVSPAPSVAPAGG